MARVKIDLPDSLPLSINMTVRVGDLNYGNHLSNDAVLAFAHEARVQYLKSFGYSELNVEGVGLIMADSAIVYKSEGFLGDKIQLKVGAGDFTKVSFDLFYQLINIETNKAVALVKTGMVCFDYDARKVAMLPELAKKKLTT